MSKTRRQIIFNSLSSWLTMILRAGVSILLVPFLIHYLGKDNYGITIIVAALVGYTAFLDLGIRNVLTRQLAEQLVKKDETSYNSLFSSSLFIFLIAGIISLLTLLIFAEKIATLLNVDENHMEIAVLLIRWYGGTAVITALTSPSFSGVLMSYNRFDLENYVSSSKFIVNGIFMFVLIPLFADHAMIIWLVISTGINIFIFVFKVFFAFRLCPYLKFRFAYVESRSFKSLLGLGSQMYLINMSNILSESSDPMVLSYYLGPQSVALYDPGRKVPSIITPVVNVLSESMHSLTTGYFVKEDYAKLQEVLFKGTRYTFALGLLIGLPLSIFSFDIARIWLEPSIGEGYKTVGIVMLGWIWNDIFTYSSGTQWPVLFGMNKLKFLLWTTVPFGVLNLLLSIYLVGYTTLGVPGVITATVIISFLRRPVQSWYTCSVCKTSLRAYFSHSYLTPLIFAITHASFTFLIATLITPTNLFYLALVLSLSGAAGVAQGFFIVLNKTERAEIVHLIKNKIF